MPPKATTRKLIPLLLVAACAACTPTPDGDGADAPVEHLVPRVVASHPFSEDAFTQGLEFEGDTLWVSTGRYGDSKVYRTTITDAGTIPTDAVELEPEYFGEGITRAGKWLWQLSWREGTAFKRDARTLVVESTVPYSGEGWGLCSYPDRIIMSDGTSQLRVVDPETFVETSRILVQEDGQPIDKLNELDCSTDNHGKPVVYANRFLTSTIYRIDAESGRVTGVIDASNLESHAAPDSNNVLNGIAQIPGTDRFLLAGKRWPQMYEVTFEPQDTTTTTNSTTSTK